MHPFKKTNNALLHKGTLHNWVTSLDLPICVTQFCPSFFLIQQEVCDESRRPSRDKSLMPQNTVKKDRPFWKHFFQPEAWGLRKAQRCFKLVTVR